MELATRMICGYCAKEQVSYRLKIRFSQGANIVIQAAANNATFTQDKKPTNTNLPTIMALL